MDAIEGIIKAGLTVVALFVIIAAIAAFFMFVFSLATSIDERIQN